MKKKALFIIPALFSLFIASCSGGGETNTSSNGGNITSSNVSSSIVAEQFTITFKDEEDKVLESKKWDKGSIPSYNYSKNDTDEWDYTVEGWATSLGGTTISIPAVSADATYGAVVSKVKKKYTITFDSNGGTSVSSITNDYGTSVSEPNKPTKDNYKFVAW